MPGMVCSTLTPFHPIYDNWGNLTNGVTFPKIGSSQTPVNNRPSATSGGTPSNFTFDAAGNMTEIESKVVEIV